MTRLNKFISTLEEKGLGQNFLKYLPFWIGSFVTGLVAVLYAKLFQLAEQTSIWIFEEFNWMTFIITPSLFLLAWYIVQKYAPMSRGSGVPQVSAAIELSNPKTSYKISNLLGIRIIIVKIISSLVMVIGGGAIGREGPTIQIAASIFKKINDILPNWYPKVSKKNMIITGAAAGLAAAFNTPLGGIVFAIEELTKTHFSFFKSAILTGVIIAGLTALNILGPYLYLGYPKLDNIPIIMTVDVIIVSVLAGLAGSGMGKIILIILDYKNRFKKKYHTVLFVLLSGLVMASLAYLVDFRVLGSGKEIMISTLFSNENHLDWYVPILRVVGPIVTFSTGAAGGVFAPSLAAGAGIGSFISGILDLTTSQTNLLILCGMVAFLTGITRSPFTSSILVIEMTNSHNIIFHLMLTALVANIVSNFISKHSFYDTLRDKFIAEIDAEENMDKENMKNTISAPIQSK